MFRFEEGATYPSLAHVEVAARSQSMDQPVCQLYLKHSKYTQKQSVKI